MVRFNWSVKRIYHSMKISIAGMKLKIGSKKKKWISYGDSITASNEWQPAVAEALNLRHINRGISGTTIAETGSIAWIDKNGNFKAKPPADQPKGTIEILSSFCSSQRINATIPLDSQLITIMGGTNDFNDSVPLGNGLPTPEKPTLDESTFIGGLCSTVEKIQARVPKCRVILMTPVPRYHDGGYEYKNKAGALTSDYAQIVREVANFYGLPCIDLFATVGWNKINGNLYLRDSMHPNPKGNARMAEVIIGELEVLQQ